MIYEIRKFNTKSRLQEMPHIGLANTAVDLELEVHLSDSDQQFLDYIEVLLKGDNVENKYHDIVHVLPPDNKELAQYIVDDSMLELLIKKHFSNDLYNKLVFLASKYL